MHSLMNKRSYRQNKGHAIREAALLPNGIFGEIGQTLNANDALAIGCTLGTMLHSKDQCLAVVGVDNRSSAGVLETEMCRGLAASGCYVMRTGVAPAPAVQFSAQCLNAASIVISGGSDHHDVNGFRLSADGVPIYGKRLRRLAALAANGGWHKARGGVLEGNILEMYIKKLKQTVRSKRPFKVAWDLCGGTACVALPELSDQISGEHLMLNDQLDSQFGFELPDAFTSTRIATLAEVVVEEKCDLGIIINADCTQIAVIDERGSLWESHRLFALFCWHVFQTEPEATIVAGLDCPTAVRQCVTPKGKLAFAPAGLGAVIEKFGSIQASAGYGDHGHYILGTQEGFTAFDDGLLSAVYLLNILSSSGEKLSSLYRRFGGHTAAPSRYFEHAEPDAVIQAVRKRLMQHNLDFNDLDGLRVDTEEGFWWLHSPEHDGKKQLVLQHAATSEAGLGDVAAGFQQYFDLVGTEIVAPKEVRLDDALVAGAAQATESARDKALKAISDSDRDEIDFASRHWRSIRKANATPMPEEETPKPKRPWQRD